MPTRLLIADDNTTIQKEFEGILPPPEFAITFAKNGKKALAKARKDKPDLIIADINMPRKNGFEVCEEVRNDPHLKGTPVLLLIDILEDFDEDESRRVGADGFIIKPFEANVAISKVRDALGLREGTPSLGKAVVGSLPWEEAVEEVVEEGTLRKEAVKEEEEVLELEEEVEELATSAPRPHEEKEGPLTLDLSIDEMEPEDRTRVPEWQGLFSELGAGEAREEIKDERLETILDERAAGLQRIEGLSQKKEENGAEKEDESREEFVKTFVQPILKTKEEGFRRTGALEHDLEGVLREAIEGLAERLGTALSHELRRMVEEMLKETVPKLLREIQMDRTNFYPSNVHRM